MKKYILKLIEKKKKRKMIIDSIINIITKDIKKYLNTLYWIIDNQYKLDEIYCLPNGNIIIEFANYPSAEKLIVDTDILRIISPTYISNPRKNCFTNFLKDQLKKLSNNELEKLCLEVL